MRSITSVISQAERKKKKVQARPAFAEDQLETIE